MGNKRKKYSCSKNKKSILKATKAKRLKFIERKRECLEKSFEDSDISIATENHDRDSSSTEPQPSTSGDAPANDQSEPMAEVYTEPEIKLERPEESAFTIVIEDPLTQTRLEGSYDELFDGKDPQQNPEQDPGKDSGDPAKDPEDPGESLDPVTIEDDPESSDDEPPAKKQQLPKQIISYYRNELARYKQEILDQLKEIQEQQKIIKAKDDQIFNLKKSMQLLRDKTELIKKDKNKLRDELCTARAELRTATQTIEKMKKKQKAVLLKAKTENTTENFMSNTVIANVTNTEINTTDLTTNTDKASENLPSVSKVNEPTTKKDQELTASIDHQMMNLTAAIDEQNLATQLLNSINDSLKELATQIDKTQMIQSQEVAIQLISSVNTQLMKLETQIREREAELAAQRERHELMMATQSILIDAVKEEVEESSDLNTDSDVQIQVFSHNQSHDPH